MQSRCWYLASQLSVSSQTSPFTILSVWLSFPLCWKVDSRTRLVYDQHFCLSSTGGLFLRWGALFIETHSNPKGSVPQIHSFLVFFFRHTVTATLRVLSFSCLRNTDHPFPISTRSRILILQSTTVSKTGIRRHKLVNQLDLRSYWRITCDPTLDGLQWTWDSQFQLDILLTLCFPFFSPIWNYFLVYTDGSQHYPYQSQ